MDRRDFLIAGTIGCSFPLLSAASRVLGQGHDRDAAVSKQFGMVIDIRKCLDEKVRRAGAEACHREHNVPQIPDLEEEVKWIWSENYENVFPDQAHPRTGTLNGKPVLVLCNHCTDPPCVKVCPVEATLKRKSDGVVVQDMHRCIGCRYCIAACPYDARSFNWRDPGPYIPDENRKGYPVRDRGVVEKCNFCAKRIREWEKRIEDEPERIEDEPEPVPACVEAANQVPGGEGALTFGNLADPKSDVSRLLDEKHTICRRIGLGTGPNIYYIV